MVKRAHKISQGEQTLYGHLLCLVKSFGRNLDSLIILKENLNSSQIKVTLYCIACHDRRIHASSEQDNQRTKTDRIQLEHHCNTLGVWLLLIAFHFINMCIIYLIMPLITETCICNIFQLCMF